MHSDRHPANVGSAPARSRDEAHRPTPVSIRLCHWVNALAMFVMIGSGWRIYNSSAIFPTVLPFIPHQITLGGDFELSLQLHGEPGLAGALLWHFAGMWLLTANFLIYLVAGFVTGHFRRQLLPVRLRQLAADLRAAIAFELPHAAGTYNAVQRLLYVGVIAAIMVMILSGLAIWKPVQLQELVVLFGGFQGARLVHFLGMAALAGFVVIHLAMVAIVPSSLRSMLTGRDRRTDPPHHAPAGD